MQKSLYKNTLFKTTLNLFNIIIPILIGPYVMRVLNSEQVGNLNFAQSMFGYFFIFGGFGVTQYGIREISRVKNDRKKLEQTFSNLFLVTLLTNIVALVLYCLFVFNKVKGQDVYYVCQLFTMYFIFNIFQVEWIVTALEEFKFITIKTIIIKLIYVIAIFICVKSPDDFNIYVFIIISTSCLGNLISYFYIKKNFKFDFTNIEIVKHLKPMFLMVIISNANVLYTQLDRYMLGEVVGATILSYYAIAQGMMGVISTLLMSVIQACIPRLNSYVGNNNQKSYIDLLRKISKGYFMILFPACVGMILLAENLIILYGGSQYIGTGIVLASFAVYMITLGFDNILTNQVLYINKCERVQVKYLFICGVLNLIFNIALIKLDIFTPVTAILTTGLANIVLVLMEHIYVKKILKLDFNIFSMENLKYMIISLIFIPIVLLIQSVGLHYILEIILSGIICSGIYFSILYFIKDKIFMEILNKVKINMNKKLKNKK